MESAIEYSIYTIGFLTCLAVLTFIIMHCVERTIHAIKFRKWMEQKHIIRSNIGELRRWCGYQFPLIEDVCDYLTEALDAEQFRTPDQFRSKMIDKHTEAKQPAI